jgi:hypothetical protein
MSRSINPPEKEIRASQNNCPPNGRKIMPTSEAEKVTAAKPERRVKADFDILSDIVKVR